MPIDFDKAARNKALRGMVLRILHSGMPRPTGTNIIESAVLGAGGSIDDAKDAIYYLEQKGYLSRRTPDQHQIPGLPDLLFISGIGIDLVEGTSQDPGVTF